MALTAPKDKQISFAKSLAWERGVRLATIPATSSALSGVIEHLLEMPALEITDGQVQTIRDLNEQCIVQVEGFTPVAELPADRAGANRLIYSMRSRLSRVQFHGAKNDAASYLAPAGSSAPVVAAETTVVSEDDAPF
jgi:hypothetical protein